MAQIEKATGLKATSGIEFLTYVTPNGHKISILLSELSLAYSLPYTTQTIDIFAGDQFAPWFTALSPNSKIPLIVDHNHSSFPVFEGAAILTYLTRLYDPNYLFSFKGSDTQDIASFQEASEAEQWLVWTHAALAPAQSQANYFYRFAPQRHAYPTFRFVTEVERLYDVLDKRLEGREYVAGRGKGRYSIVDMAVFPFANAIMVCGLELSRWGNVYAWAERVLEREGVQKGLCVPGGEMFKWGFKVMEGEREKDPEAWAEREEGFRRALEGARREFGGK